MLTETPLIPPIVPPKVVVYFKFYAAFLCLIYLAVAVGSAFFFFSSSADPKITPLEAGLIGGLFLAFGLGLFAICLVPLLLRPHPWLWMYDLVVICLGMSSACFLPICVPLLIFWLKPETKQYFGKG